MSMFGDYKSYKKYEPAYSEWKNNRNILEAKREAYLNKHPELVNQKDIQRGKILLRAIDIMDEYSQKKAENMEATTESIIGMGLDLAFFGGVFLGGLLGMIKPIGEFFQRFAAKGSKNAKIIGIGIPAVIGGVLGTLAAFPLMAWGAKAEVSASRKGRFEAMRKELSNSNGFAILTEEQLKEANEKSKKIVLDDKSFKSKIKNSFASIKEMALDSKEYKIQRMEFEKELEQDEKNINKKMTEKEIESAKRDQQLLTKLVEKIDIASQDYAENSELATQTAILGVGATGGILSIGVGKILNAMKIKSAGKIDAIIKVLSIAAFALMSIFSAQINKHASRVGRYKVKQELLNNPNNFVYVDDSKINDIKDFELKSNKKQNVFSFLKNAWKNNREYNNYKKTVGKEERKFFKAVEDIKLTPEQLKEAKKLQKNTFRTFNKVDENSQKYAESIEALGQSIAYPITTLCTVIATLFALPYLEQEANTKIEKTKNLSKYIGIIWLSLVPAIIINAIITKEQKKASRIADMKAIEELNDYRKFG